MPSSKRNSRTWKVLTLALLVVPWFLKDHLATALDERSREAQEVLIEEHSQEQREEQGFEQRQLIDRLARIELRQMQTTGELPEAQVAKAVAEDLSRSFGAEGKALQHSTQTFNELLPKIAMEAGTRKSLEGKVHQVEAIAQDLQKYQPEASHGGNQALLEHWGQAELALGDAYGQLFQEAERDRDSSAKLALWSRLAAWTLTAVAAILMGDWRKRFGGEGEGA